MSGETFCGIPVIVSKYVPREGWYDRDNAEAIRAQNLDALAHGGRLIDCEPPRRWWPGFALLDGTLIAEAGSSAIRSFFSNFSDRRPEARPPQ